MANGQAGCPLHAMLSDPLPNDLMSIAYDRTKDGIPDYFFLHPITWSWGSVQGIGEIEHQASMDERWVFIVGMIKTSPLPSRFLRWLLFILHKQVDGWLKRCGPLTCKYCNNQFKPTARKPVLEFFPLAVPDNIKSHALTQTIQKRRGSFYTIRIFTSQWVNHCVERNRGLSPGPPQDLKQDFFIKPFARYSRGSHFLNFSPTPQDGANRTEPAIRGIRSSYYEGLNMEIALMIGYLPAHWQWNLWIAGHRSVSPFKGCRNSFLKKISSLTPQSWNRMSNVE